MEILFFNDFLPYGKIFSKVITSIIKINSFKKSKDIKVISPQNDTFKLSYGIINLKITKNNDKY